MYFTRSSILLLVNTYKILSSFDIVFEDVSWAGNGHYSSFGFFYSGFMLNSTLSVKLDVKQWPLCVLGFFVCLKFACNRRYYYNTFYFFSSVSRNIMEFSSSKFSAGNGCFFYEDNDVLIIVVFDDFWGVGLSRLFFSLVSRNFHVYENNDVLIIIVFDGFLTVFRRFFDGFLTVFC